MKELLVPAGNMECLKQAVLNGADAVYLALQKFGARKFAKNFTDDEIKEAVSYCHLYGVKVYVTMNTLVRDNEVEQFIDQARFLHKIGVDALIVQDLGMIYLLRNKFPNLEIHASTQANNSSVDTIKMFYNLGIKRVVLSRELSLDEINDIDIPIEKEVFIHGALCVSYSGCCLMSSMNGGRSGNRGECAGSCRLPYSLYKDGKLIKKDCYLLSMKELNTSRHIKELLNSKIDSFKIEGRMKGALYVGFITRLYRRLIDGNDISIEEETDKLKTIFNREFTSGHLFNNKGKELINEKSPNHIGLEIGKAVVEKDKIKIILSPGRELHQFDSIRFLNSNKGMVINYLYDKNDKLINSSNSVCYIDNKVLLNNDDILCKTQDYFLEKEYLNSLDRKIPISFKVVGKIGDPLSITISDGTNIISSEIGIVEKAKSMPITVDSIKEKLSKLGNTLFAADNIDIDLDDNSFIQIKMINDLKRQLVDKLIQNRQANKTKFMENGFSFDKINTNNSIGKSYTCRVSNEEQLLTCLKYPFKRIYISNEELYKKYSNNDKVFLSLERCFYKNSYNRAYTSDAFNFSGEFYGNYALNVTNIYTAYILNKLGLKNIPLSVELSNDEIDEFIKQYNSKIGNSEFEIMSYGRIENMVIKDNILNINCNHEYSIRDSKGNVYPVIFDGIKTHIYHSDVLCNNYSCSNVTMFFDFTNETEEEIVEVMKRFNIKNNC